MILRLTLNVGMITGLATTEGKPRPVRHEPFSTDTIGYLSANKPVWCKVVDGIDIECWYIHMIKGEATTKGKPLPVQDEPFFAATHHTSSCVTTGYISLKPNLICSEISIGPENILTPS